MNSDDLSDAINTLEKAIDNGIFDMPKNEKKLKKILNNFSKIQNVYANKNSLKSEQKKSKINTESTNISNNNDILNSSNTSIKNTTESDNGNQQLFSYNSIDLTKSNQSGLSKKSESSESYSNTTVTTCSELIPITNNQPPSDIFVCDESDCKIDNNFYHHNLAMTVSTSSNNDDSDQIIVLK